MEGWNVGRSDLHAQGRMLVCWNDGLLECWMLDGWMLDADWNHYYELFSYFTEAHKVPLRFTED